MNYIYAVQKLKLMERPIFCWHDLFIFIKKPVTYKIYQDIESIDNSPYKKKAVEICKMLAYKRALK